MWIAVWFVVLAVLVAASVVTERRSKMPLVLYAAWGAFFLLSSWGWSRQ